jgi:hypothetical protein
MGTRVGGVEWWLSSFWRGKPGGGFSEEGDDAFRGENGITLCVGVKGSGSGGIGRKEQSRQKAG